MTFSARPLMAPRVGQSYLERPPIAALAGIISSTWVQYIPVDAAPYVHRSIPHGGADLLCRIGSIPHLAGPLTRARIELLPPGSTVVGLRFNPGAVATVLGVPTSEISDLVVDVDTLWGSEAKAVGARMAEVASAERAGALLQELVVRRLANATRPNPVVAEAMRRLIEGQPGDIESLRSSLAVSERSFRRQCHATIGVGPKTLQRTLRFQRVLARAQYALSRGPRPAHAGLALLADACGYADQAHLTRECKRLTGVTPRVFLRETEEACCGHDHDHEARFAQLVRPPV